MRPFLLAKYFLLSADESGGADEPRWRTAGRWFALWGLLIGIFYAVVFRLGWRWFGEYLHLRLAPVVCVLIVDLAYCGYRNLSAAAELLNRRAKRAASDPAAVTLPALVAILLIALAKLVILLSLPIGAKLPPADWRQYLLVIFPGVIYRPLILAPLWGRWAMMLALSIGRVAPGGSERLRRMAGGIGLPVIMLNWLFCAAATAFYVCGTGRDIPYCVVIALSIMVAVYLVSFRLARGAGGQTEATVGVAGLVGELVFLACYLPVARAIYWY